MAVIFALAVLYVMIQRFTNDVGLDMHPDQKVVRESKAEFLAGSASLGKRPALFGVDNQSGRAELPLRTRTGVHQEIHAGGACKNCTRA